MLWYLDIIVVLMRVHWGWLFIPCVVCSLLSYVNLPYTAEEISVEACEILYSQGEEYGSGDKYCRLHVYCLNGKELFLSVSDSDFDYFWNKGYKHWNNLFKGKTARIKYLDRSSANQSNILRSIELSDSRFSYRDSQKLSSYDSNKLLFCLTAFLAVFSAIIILRFFYLLMFASDELRQKVFGDKNYNPYPPDKN